jgi:hypothetical protein
MGRGAFSSYSRSNPPKKRTSVSYQNPTLQTPSSQKPPREEADHDASIVHQLIGAYLYDTCMHLCPDAPHRLYHGVGRGQPLTDPSPGTIPRICSPFSTLVVSCPPPCKFALMFLIYQTTDALRERVCVCFCVCVWV